MKINTEKNKTKNTITIDYENKRLSTFYFLPLLLIAGFVPLIVYAKYVDLSGTTQALYWTGQQQYLDFFSYWKAQWVVVLTAIALVFYIILYMQKKLPLKDLKQYYIPMGIYALFVIISTVFAIDTQTALWGFVDMYQGMFVLLSYMLITFLTINFVNNERDVNLFVNAFLFLMIVEGIIGVGQYFGFDLFQTKLGKDLIIPNYLQVDNLSFSFGPKTIYGTLFNTNFVGSFATLMLPLSLGIFLSAKTRNRKIVSGITVVLMIFTWIGCNSRAGYLGVVASVPFALWLFRKEIVKHRKGSVGFAVVALLAVVGLNVASGGALFERLKTFNVVEQLRDINQRNEGFKFEDIILGKDNVTIKTNMQTLTMKVDTDKLYFLDENNNELEIEQRNSEIKIKNFDKYWQISNINIPKNYPGVSVTTHWGYGTTNFYIAEDGIKILGSGGRITSPIKAERTKQFDGLEYFMSGRGYIWSRTIPMISKYILSGAGADNYPMAFPQDDVIAKLNIYMDANTVIDKPHNMYLQIAMNTGLLSLIALISIWGIYIISSLKLYSKLYYDSIDKLVGVSCLLSVISYLVVAIFNDSVVSVAPIFWIMLGIGIAINRRIKKKIAQS